MAIDNDRCLRAMRDLEITGVPTSGRHYLIEEAIAAIQKDGATALAAEYFGIKNYAAFGDQREDHEYGYHPRHGSIVFRIGRQNRHAKTVLGDDHIYLLECVRDFGSYKDEYAKDERGQPRRGNLCDLLQRLRRCEEQHTYYLELLNTTEVKTHTAAATAV